MRITTEKLLDLALKEAESRSGIVSGYVIGSTANGDPLVGGTADIDLVLIHEYEPIVPREIIPLSHEVHLDVAHHSKRLYEQPRDLRVDPWLGPAMCEPVFLYDPSHFFEWAQASVRGQFHRSDYAHARAAAFLDRARESLSGLEVERLWLNGWLRALLEAANAVASLDGFPASGRRVMPQLKDKLTALGHPEIYGHFLRLLGVEHFEDTLVDEWVEAWMIDFEAASELSAHPELAEVRRDYYLGGYRSMIEDASAVEVLWQLLSTWDQAVHVLASEDDNRPGWDQVLDTLQLSTDHAREREAELEDFMDQVEGVLDHWAEGVGV